MMPISIHRCHSTLVDFAVLTPELGCHDSLRVAIVLNWTDIGLTVYNNNNNLTYIMHLKHAMQTQGAGHCTSAKRMTSILKHVAEALAPAWQGTILNSHRVISIAANT